jgi:hypothetical protein
MGVVNRSSEIKGDNVFGSIASEGMQNTEPFKDSLQVFSPPNRETVVRSTPGTDVK